MHDKQAAAPSHAAVDERTDAVICVVMVSWNSREDVVQCLHALRAQGCARLHVVVVDNGSSDGTVEAVHSQFPEVFVDALGANQGFARAANRGIRYALENDAEYVLLLNPDTSFGTDLLPQLAAFMQTDSRLAIVSPKVFLQDLTNRLWGIGGTLDHSGPRFVGMEEDDTGAYDNVTLDFVLGCAMFVRARALREIGSFDERFFAFYEELDLCVRVKAAGWRVALAPHIHLRHAGAKTTRNQPQVRVFHLARSRMLFLRKYSERFSAWPLFRRELYEFVRLLLHALNEGRPASAAALVRGVAGGLFGRPPASTSEAMMRPS